MLSPGMQIAVDKLQSKELAFALKAQSVVLSQVHEYMREKGVLQLLPVIVSPITDPLNHSVLDCELTYFGERMQLTKSMILHKQLSLIGSREAIYIISPNVRLETLEKGSTGRHLLEFTQVDFELAGKDSIYIMKFMEELLGRIIGRVREDCGPELEYFGRSLKTPKFPLKKYDSQTLQEKYGPDWEKTASALATEPFWATNHEREFYDKEDPSKPFTYLNYDLVYPEGFGEALSGAERESGHEQILERMKRKKMDLEPYSSYLEVAKAGLLKPSAGAGFGVERMVRYITGSKHIRSVSPFAKVPGEKFIF
jgi:asparaginyl-tRNA synthetase